MLSIEENDVCFAHSHDAGHPCCLCSRCKKVIPEEQIPIRCLWQDEETGHYGEYRYCEKCFLES